MDKIALESLLKTLTERLKERPVDHPENRKIIEQIYSVNERLEGIRKNEKAKADKQSLAQQAGTSSADHARA